MPTTKPCHDCAGRDASAPPEATDAVVNDGVLRAVCLRCKSEHDARPCPHCRRPVGEHGRHWVRLDRDGVDGIGHGEDAALVLEDHGWTLATLADVYLRRRGTAAVRAGEARAEVRPLGLRLEGEVPEPGPYVYLVEHPEDRALRLEGELDERRRRGEGSGRSPRQAIAEARAFLDTRERDVEAGVAGTGLLVQTGRLHLDEGRWTLEIELYPLAGG